MLTQSARWPCTGGLLSSAHTEQDIAEATEAFEATVGALIDEGLVQNLK